METKIKNKTPAPETTVSQEVIAAQDKKIAAQDEKIHKLTKLLGKSVPENPTSDKRGFPLRPKFDASELSKMVPLDKFFNKVRSYNKGTVKSPSEVVEKCDYIHFHYQNKKYRFWRGLELTNAQIKELPEDYVNRLCGSESKKV